MQGLLQFRGELPWGSVPPYPAQHQQDQKGVQFQDVPQRGLHKDLSCQRGTTWVPSVLDFSRMVLMEVQGLPSRNLPKKQQI